MNNTSRTGCANRRLRKKLRVGEFQELGFEVSFELSSDLAEHELMRFWAAFISEAIERNGLAYGGSTSGFVTSWGRGSTTEAHRESIEAWLRSRAEVLAVDIGPLMDAWHGGESENAL